MGATLFVHPFDLLKNRMQLAGRNSTAKISFVATVKNIAKAEGVVHFYDGLSAGMLRQATYTTTRLGLYNALLENFRSQGRCNLHARMPLTEAQQARLAETRRSAAQRSHVTDETKAAAIVAAEEREIRQRNHSLTLECARLNGVVSSVTQDLDQFQQVSQDAQSQAGAAQNFTRKQAAQIANLQQTVEELRRGLEAAESEKQELLMSNKQLSRRRDQYDSSAPSMDEKSTTIIVELEQKLQQHKYAADEEMALLRQQQVALQTELAQLQESAAAQRATLMEGFRRSAARRDEELQALKEELQSARLELARSGDSEAAGTSLGDELMAQEFYVPTGPTAAKLQKLEEDNARLAKEAAACADRTAECVRLAAALKQAETVAQGARAERDSAVLRAQKLQAEMSGLQAEIEAKEKLQGEQGSTMRVMQARVSQLEGEAAQLGRQLAFVQESEANLQKKLKETAATHKTEAQSVSQRVSDLQKELAELNERLAEVKSAADTQEQRDAMQSQSVCAQLATVQAEKILLETTLREHQARGGEELRSGAQEIGRLKLLITDMEAANARFAQDSERQRLASAAECKQLSEMIDRLESEKAILQKQLECDKELLGAQVEQLTARHRETSAASAREQDRLKQALNDSSVALAAAEKAHQQLQTKHDSQAAQLAELNRRLDQTAGEAGNVKASAAVREQELRHKLMEMQKKLDETTAQLTEQSALRQDTEARLKTSQIQAAADIEQVRADHARRCKDLEESVAEQQRILEEQTAALAEQLKLNEAAFAARESELLADLQVKSEHVNRLQEELREQQTSAETSTKLLRAEIDSVKSAAAALNVSFGQEQRRIAVLTHEVSEAKAQVGDLKAQIDTLSKTHAAAQQDLQRRLADGVAAAAKDKAAAEKKAEEQSLALQSARKELALSRDNSSKQLEENKVLLAQAAETERQLRQAVEDLGKKNEAWQVSYQARERQLVEHFQGQVTPIATALAESQQRTITVEEQVKQLLARDQQLQQYIAACQTELTTAQDRLNQAAEIDKEVRSRFSVLQSEAVAFKQAADAKILETQKETLTLSRQLEERQRTVADLEEKLRLQVQTHNSATTAHTAAIQQLETKLAVAIAASLAASTERGASAQQLDEKQRHIDTLQESEQLLRARLEAVGSEADTLMRAQIDQMMDQQAKKDAVHAKTISDLAAAKEAAAREYEKEITDINSQLQMIEQRDHVLQRDLTAKSEQLSKRESEIQRLSEEIASLRAAELEKDSVLRIAQRNLASTTADLQDSHKQVATLQAQIEELKTQLKSEKERYQQFELQSGELCKELQSLQESLNKAQQTSQEKSTIQDQELKKALDRHAQKEAELTGLQIAADKQREESSAAHSHLQQAFDALQLEKSNLLLRIADIERSTTLNAEQNQTEIEVLKDLLAQAQTDLLLERDSHAATREGFQMQLQEQTRSFELRIAALNSFIADQRSVQEQTVLDLQGKLQLMTEQVAVRERDLLASSTIKDQDIKRLEKELSEAKSGAQKSASDNQMARAEAAQLELQIAALRTSAASSSASEQRKQAQIAALEKELGEQRRHAESRMTGLNEELERAKSERAVAVAGLEGTKVQLEDALRREALNIELVQGLERRLIESEAGADATRQELEQAYIHEAELNAQLQIFREQEDNWVNEVADTTSKLLLLQGLHSEAEVSLKAAAELEVDMRATLNAKEGEIASLKSSNQILQQDLAGLRARTASLENELRARERDVVAREKDLNLMQSQERALQVSITTLNANLASLQDQSSRELAEAQYNNSQLRNRIAELQRELDQVRSNLAERDAALQKTRESEIQAKAEWNHKLVDLQAHVDANAAIVETHEESLAAAYEDVQRLEDEVNHWQREHSIVQSQLAREQALSRSQLDTLQQEKEELNVLNRRLNAQLESTRQTVEDLTAAKQHVEAEVEAQASKIRELEGQVESEGRRNASLTETNNDLDRENQQLKDDLTLADMNQRELLEDIQNLKNEIAEAERMKKMDGRKAQSERALLLNDLEDLREVKAKQSAEIGQLQEQVTRGMEQMQRLREQGQQQREDLQAKDEENESLLAEINDLLSIQQELRDENRMLRASTSREESHSLISGASAAVLALDANEQLDELQKEASSARQREAALQRDLDARSNKVARQDEQIGSLETENEGLRTEVSDLMTLLSQARSGGSSTRLSAPSLFPSVNMELLAAQEEIQLLNDKLARVQREINAEHLEQIAAFEADVASLEKDKKKLQAESETMLQLVAELGQANDTLKKTSAERHMEDLARYDQVKQELDVRGQELEEQSARLARAEQSLQQREQQLERLKSSTAREISQLRERVDDLEHENEGLVSEVNELLSIVSEQNQTITDQREKLAPAQAPSLLSDETLQSIDSEFK